MTLNLLFFLIASPLVIEHPSAEARVRPAQPSSRRGPGPRRPLSWVQTILSQTPEGRVLA